MLMQVIVESKKKKRQFLFLMRFQTWNTLIHSEMVDTHRVSWEREAPCLERALALHQPVICFYHLS